MKTNNALQHRQTLIVSGIQMPLHEVKEEAFRRALHRIRQLGLPSSDCRCAVYRRSVDARKQDRVHFVYAIAVQGNFSKSALTKLSAADVAWMRAEAPSITPGVTPLFHRPVVVGSGPAGLFCAYLLARSGYCPLLLERGGDVESRAAAHARFCKDRILDTENNIQFGAGGAGTFSDGKLVSRINDPLTGWLLERLVDFGAPEEILTMAKPHIGTDYLRRVVTQMIQEIRALGGEVRFMTKVTDVVLQNGRATALRLQSGEMLSVGALVLAVGNAARDTYRMLLGKDLAVEAKPFSVGMRIEHLQEEIDAALYGRFAGDSALGHAEYQLSYDTAHRGVYTFCMCPGGEVMAAASEEGGVVVNGMSHHARSGKNANSAVVCSVQPEDFGNTPQGAMEYQRRIEEAAYQAGGASYFAPLTTVGDFLENNTYTSTPTRVSSTYMGGDSYTIASPCSYLPAVVVGQIRDGLRYFGKRIRGFDAPYALLTGAETRTSAPLRILRGEDRCALGTTNLYPCGEGAGYAGGITSAAIDGIRTAMALISRFRLPEIK